MQKKKRPNTSHHVNDLNEPFSSETKSSYCVATILAVDNEIFYPIGLELTVIETSKYMYLVTPGEAVSLCALEFELTEQDSSDLGSIIPASTFVTVFLLRLQVTMSTQLLANELLNLESSTKDNSLQ